MSDWISRESPIHLAASGYLDWRECCAHVSRAYREWAAAPLKQCARAHAMYLTALEQEERAAEGYSRALAGRARRTPWGQ
jgi:hypothetical protein